MATIDLDFAHDEAAPLEEQVAAWLGDHAPDVDSFRVVTRFGSGGGWPIVRFGGSRDALKRLCAAYGDPDLVD